MEQAINASEVDKRTVFGNVLDLAIDDEWQTTLKGCCSWQRERGIRSFFMHDVRDRGIKAVVEDALSGLGAAPVFLTVDIDVLDPAFAPGTGTPEPGGMTTTDLLWACREIASRVELVGADVVEVIPTAVGSADITALAADRIVREILTGLAVAKAR